jgi:outer membrane receptor protein involved in Fe transport
MFIQTNPNYFTMSPQFADITLPAEKSIHRAASVEQRISKYTFRAEAFYNTFSNSIDEDVKRDEDDKLIPFLNNSGKMVSRGVELSVKVNNEDEDKLWGWASYTYNNSKLISHQSKDYTPYGEDWITSYYDMPHVIKAIIGYTIGKNTISGRFQFNSSMPYDRIIGSESDDLFTSVTGKLRILPVYGKPNTGRLSPEYQLDIRYSRKTNYKWGYLSWYIEAIGIVTSSSQYWDWDYRYHYQPGVNPKLKKENTLLFVPNFGIEVRF